MTRTELIDQLAQRFPQLVIKVCEIAVKELLDSIGNALISGHRVEIRGFGSFDLNYRPPRQGRNPKTGEAVAVPAKRAPHFKASKTLRERFGQSVGVRP